MSPDAPIAVRRATAADLPAILTLVRSCDDAPGWTEAAWHEFAAAQRTGEPGRLLLLVQAGGEELCGLLAATSLVGRTELEAVLAARSARRRGIGRALLLAWLSWAQGEGATEAMLEVRASNLAALALYRSLGFAVQGRRPGYYREPPEDALLMGRQVGAS